MEQSDNQPAASEELGQGEEDAAGQEPAGQSPARQSPAAQGLYDPRYEHDACGIGFVVDIKGRKSNQILRQGLTVLTNLAHRGATGSEANTGDGAGILFQLPDAFFRQVAALQGFHLPPSGHYGLGMLFLPQSSPLRERFEGQFAALVEQAGQELLGWRDVPANNTALGDTAKAGEPFIRQVFIGRAPQIQDDEEFERVLYLIRRRAENTIFTQDEETGPYYIASLSSRTIVYKGMLMATQLDAYYPDLADPAITTAIAVVHSRFSTNTFPSWERAHPNRYIVHNGEINTIRGNVNWMRARQADLVSPLFGDHLQELLPIIDEDGSDSAMFDNTLEFLHLAGRSLPHAIMMMIPEPWSKHESMPPANRAFYEYHSCLLEPWDGPSLIGFSDGIQVGAVLDRNGLRPSRYLVTRDGLVVMASEAGVLDIPPEQIAYKGRLQPGKMLLVDTGAGRIISDREVKETLATAQPYQEWLDQQLLHLDELESGPGPQPATMAAESAAGLVQRQLAFGYTFEDLRVIIAPMATNGLEPLGSMGDDTPLAVLSDRPQLLYSYFKQLFAQVTNPPIDAIREELVTGTDIRLGSEGNILSPDALDCRRIKLESPILTDAQLNKLRYIDRLGFSAATLPILVPLASGAIDLEAAMERLFQEAVERINQGANLLILSDRGIDRAHTAIPALLATAGLHHYLISQGLRTRVSLIIESAEPREVHHFATLISYGADAINPYLAYETVAGILDKQWVSGISLEAAVQKYIKAVVKGVVKVISKMGISTVQSYHSAQIHEAVGLHPAVVDRYFCGTPSRIGGIGLEALSQEVVKRHQRAFPERPSNGHVLEAGGKYQWRSDGETHTLNPGTIHLLQQAVRSGDYEAYKRYAAEMDDHTRQASTLRGLLTFKEERSPVPLDEVESVEALLSRFKTGAMSYGSISQEAHETLAIAMNRLGGKSNTGEGGEDPARFSPDANGDSRNSAIKQVASGRFGVTSEYLVNAQEIQIKMAQGAKPGEGGQLPGQKVYPWIAKVRYSTPGVGLISPPPHHDIYSIEDLAQLIYDLKNANRRARISVKLVSEVGVGTVAAGVAKGKADVILISGHDGGTGASPQTSIKHAGLPWELGLAETHQTLLLNDLRSRVTLETDGQLRTGRDVAVAALLGAEEFGFATAPLVALGCIMMRVCHMDTCPVGIATQNPELRQHFAGDPQHVINLMTFLAQDLREWMARLGFRRLVDMVGRSDILEQDRTLDHWKAGSLDLNAILHRPDVPETTGRYHQIAQIHDLEESLDVQFLLEMARPALEKGWPVDGALPIRNIHRAVGTILGSEVTARYGAAGLPEDTITLLFNGSAGQSFGAFIPNGLTLTLAGEANDYLGKGLSGGKIVVYPPEEATFNAAENIITGNVAFYGATAGQAFISGLAGERFCVRNSGLEAVVEGLGDHGCEYMTGGRVVVLGPTGRNFGAGMSGGVAYVFDEAGDFPGRCNQEMVSLMSLVDEQEIAALEELIWRHALHTGSRRAWDILSGWSKMWPFFVKVVPKDYQRMLTAISAAERGGSSGEEAIMAAFESNKRQLAAVSGD